jgi:hypothetical protein
MESCFDYKHTKSGISVNSKISYHDVQVKKVKISLLQAMEAPRVARG